MRNIVAGPREAPEVGHPIWYVLAVVYSFAP